MKKENNPEYYEITKKKHAEQERRRRKKLGEIYNARERERNKKPERIEQKRKAEIIWQFNNKERLSKYRKRYRTTINPDAIKASEQNRRARHKSAGYLSGKEWKEILEENNHACYYCGKIGIPLEQEHKIPLARGGKHNKENVVPACRNCNATKYMKTDEEYLEFVKHK